MRQQAAYEAQDTRGTMMDETPSVGARAYWLTFLVQLESGRTGRSIQSVREKKSKKADHIRRSFESLSLNILYSSNSSYSSLPMLPYTGQSSVRQAKLGVSDWVQVPIE